MKNYLSVNNIRFLSMLGIVGIHSFIFHVPAGMYQQEPVELYGGQLLKFGTLCFFMISGFLLGDNLDRYDPLEFLKRRIRSVGRPWAFWSFVMLILLLLNKWLKHQPFNLLGQFDTVLFHTEYWFVPNFILALSVLILLRRHLDSLWTGLFFLSLSLFYAANVYLNIVPAEHTTALFGYPFYLWLGYQFRRGHWSFLQRLQTLSFPVLWGAIIFTYGLACLETIVLNHYALQQPDINPLNTLKLSNQMYAVCVYLLVSRFTRPIYPVSLDPRNETFGIYLTHWIIMTFYGAVLVRVLSAVTGVLPGGFESLYYTQIPGLLHLAIWLLSVVIIYGLALMTTRLIGYSRFFALVGLKKRLIFHEKTVASLR